MSPAVKNVVLLVVIVAVLVVAGMFMFRGGKERSYPDDPASITHWMDFETGELFHLTAAELEDWRGDPNKRRSVKESGSRQMVFFNPATNDYTICGAKKDKKTGEWFCPMGPDGTAYAAPSRSEDMEDE